MDSGFHAMDSAFKVVDSGFLFGSSWISDSNYSGIADSLSYIPDYKAQDSGFHKNSGMRITFSYMESGKESKRRVCHPEAINVTDCFDSV